MPKRRRSNVAGAEGPGEDAQHSQVAEQEVLQLLQRGQQIDKEIDRLEALRATLLNDQTLIRARMEQLTELPPP